MSASSSENAASPSVADSRLLAVIKFLFVLIVACLVIAGNNARFWPLVSWPMFDNYGSEPPDGKDSAIQIRVVDRAGKIYRLSGSDLSTTLPPDVVGKLIDRALNDKIESRRPAEFAQITALVQAALPDVEIVGIQAWRLSWQGKPDESPAYDVAQPDQETLLGGFQVADGEPVP